MSITPLMPVYPRCGVRPVEGDNCHLIDEDGTRYLDFAAGIAVNLLGHSHPGLIGAIQQQAAKLMHVSNLYGSPQGEELAQKLVDTTFADTVFFTNSGAEAVECAIKTARRYQFVSGHPERTHIVTFAGAFHGRTLATLSATGNPKYQEGFGPAPEGFDHVPQDFPRPIAQNIRHCAGNVVTPPGSVNGSKGHPNGLNPPLDAAKARR